MKARWQAVRGQLTLEGIPTTRRHVYFYLLLTLITIVAHNMYKHFNDAANLPEAVGQREGLDHVPCLASAIQRYEQLSHSLPEKARP